MKILTLFGTRPEIIRLSLVMRKLDPWVEHVMVHTGQNSDPHLSEIFFEELQIRKPNYFLGATGTFGEQMGVLFEKFESILLEERPDRVLVLGDTNSGLGTLCAKRMGIPVFHLEAGNRCLNDEVPEEINRRVIDHLSDIWMPYTKRSRNNLTREGVPHHRIFVVGNPIFEVINFNKDRIRASPVMMNLKLESRKYFLVTLHRSEGVDQPTRLQNMLEALQKLAEIYKIPVVVSTHPRLKSKMQELGNHHSSFLRFLDPFGFFDFVHLEQNAKCVLTDSGTVQEECCIFGVPNVTLRSVTERPETLECGSNLIAGYAPSQILKAVEIAIGLSEKWNAPEEYLVENTSERVLKILLSYHCLK